MMTFGNMGGSVQPETHAQHMVNMIDLGHERPDDDRRSALYAQSEQQHVSLETNLFALVGEALKAKGTTCARPTAVRSVDIRGFCSRWTHGCRRRSSMRGQRGRICR
jgi:gamma-glutamyltranspeptidase